MSDQQQKGAPMKFPGLQAWLGIVIGVLWGASWLQIWASDAERGRLLDPTIFFIGRPLLMGVGLLMGIGLWSWALRIRVREALVTGWHWFIGFLLLPTVINLLFRFFGLSVQSWPYVAGREWMTTLLSAGWYPRPLASPGLLVALMIGAWGIGWTVWKWREEKTRALLAGFGTYFVFECLLSIPSFIAWLGMEGVASWWNASGYAVQRGMISLLNQQYWWQSVYERFPGTLGGEAEVSEALLLMVLAYIFLMGAWLWSERERFSGLIHVDKVALREAASSKTGVLFAAVCFGLFFGLSTLVSGGNGLIFWISLLLALVVSGSFLLSFSAFFFAERESRWVLRIMSLIGAWLLGWPVFASLSFLWLLIQGRVLLVANQSSILLRIMFEAGILTSAFLGAWAFGGQKATFSEFSLEKMIGLWLFFCVHEAMMSETASQGNLMSLRRNVFKEFFRSEKGKSLIILLSYLILPVAFKQYSWFLLALPFGCIAALLALGSRVTRERYLRLTTTIFLLLSYFFLRLSGFHS